MNYTIELITKYEMNGKLTVYLDPEKYVPYTGATKNVDIGVYSYIGREIKLTGATSGYVKLIAPSVAGAQTYSLPTSDGSAGYSLKTDGAGNLYFGAISEMVYPGAGIPLSTGSAWGSSITNNSANWNTAYGWGDHAGLYSLLAHNHSGTYQPVHDNLTSLAGLSYVSAAFVKMTGANTFSLDTNTYLTSLSGALLATGVTTGATSQAQAFTYGVITGKIYPPSDSTTAIQINKADGITNVINVDTTNLRVGFGTTTPSYLADIQGGTKTDTSGTINNVNSDITFTPASASSANIRSFSAALTTSGSQNLTGTNVAGIISLTNSNTGTITDLRGCSLTLSNSAASGTITNVYGGLYYVANTSTGTITTGRGGLLTIRNTGAGAIGGAIGGTGEVQNTGGGTITTASGLLSTVVNTSGTITNLRGLYVSLNNAGGTATNTYGIYIDSMTGGTQTNPPFAIYQSTSTDKNYFAGSVGVGMTMPQVVLHVFGQTINNGDAYRNFILVDKNSYGTGIGAGISFGGYYSGDSYVNDFAGIQGFKENASSGDYAGALRFTTRINGGSPTERMRIRADGNTGFGTANPTAVVHLKAGTATAGTAPLKFTSGPINTSAEAGTQEYYGVFYQSKYGNIRYALGGTLNSQYADTGNVGAGEDTLHTYVVTRDTLSSDGSFLSFDMTFTFAANANSKQVKIYFGGTVIYDSTAQVQNGGVLNVFGKIIRTGAATQRVVCVATNTASVPLFATGTYYTTPAETLSGDVTLKATGEAVDNNDIVHLLTNHKYNGY